MVFQHAASGGGHSWGGSGKLIPKIEQAIADYPYGKPGGYRIYPGPNSNTFVAHVLRSVPELGVVLPSDAVGRDYLPNGAFYHVADDWKDASLSLGGLFGISAGARSASRSISSARSRASISAGPA